MDNELKETLLKVADYHELEKQKAARIGSISFSLMFLTCAMAIVIQMVITGDLALVAGETVILLAGGLAYVYFMVKSGIWNKNTAPKYAKERFYDQHYLYRYIQYRVLPDAERESRSSLYCWCVSLFFYRFYGSILCDVEGFAYPFCKEGWCVKKA